MALVRAYRKRSRSHVLEQRPLGVRLMVRRPSEARCVMCEDASSTEGNVILLCDGPCKYGFHQLCLGLETVPEEATWFCSDECAEGRAPRRDDKSLAELRSRARAECYVADSARALAFWNDFEWEYLDDRALEASVPLLTAHELPSRPLEAEDTVATPSGEPFSFRSSCARAACVMC
jgi:hypothetical protein